MKRPQTQLVVVVLGALAIACGSNTKTSSEAREPQPAGTGTRSLLWNSDPRAPTILDTALQKVQVESVRHLRASPDFETPVDSTALHAFVERVRVHALSTIGQDKRPFEASVMFFCSPDGHQANAMGPPYNADPRLWQQFKDGLPSLETLPVRRGRVAFIVRLTVSP